MASYRTIGKYDLDVLFQEVYNQREKKIIGRILMLLADYLVLETSILFKLYKARYKEDLKLQYIKKAARDLLIVEFKYNLSEETEKNIFFYALKKNGGEHILKSGNYDFTMIPYFWAYQEISIILTFNKYFAENNFDEKISTFLINYLSKGIFFNKEFDQAYFLSKIISENEVDKIVSDLYERINPKPIFPPQVVEISEEIMDFGELTSASDPRVVS